MIVTLGMILGIGGLLYFWNYIVHFFQTKVIPWFSLKFGKTAAECLVNIIRFADMTACMARKAIRASWNWFQAKFLRMKTKYIRDNSRIHIQTETIYQNIDGDIIKRIEESIDDFVNIPANVRTEMMRTGATEITTDSKELLEHKFLERAHLEGELLEIKTST